MSISIDSCESDKDIVARRLAASHRAVDPSISGIYRLEIPEREGDPDEPIKLLEINQNTTISGVMPVGLSTHPSSGIYFPSVVVEIHPSEFSQLQQGQITLPDGWVFDENKQL